MAMTQSHRPPQEKCHGCSTAISASTVTAEGASGRGCDPGLEVAWQTPPYHQCNFTALDSRSADHEGFRRLLLEMVAADAELCEAMRLENVTRWVEATSRDTPI
jgi:hypothetical protein